MMRICGKNEVSPNLENMSLLRRLGLFEKSIF
jgi:hypothetical protein